MTELRRRMDEDMVARGMADRTRESYLWAVKDWRGTIAGRPIRSRTRRCKPTCGICCASGSDPGARAHRGAWPAVLLPHDLEARPHDVRRFPAPRQPAELPVVLSAEEVERVIAHDRQSQTSHDAAHHLRRRFAAQ